MEFYEVDQDSAYETFIQNEWTDGLPIILPTPARVEAMLAAGGAEADEILGSVPERRRSVTAGHAAINAVMAGCKPDYFPVVLAALRAMLDPIWGTNAILTSTSGGAACIIVSGPLAEAIGMNARSNLFGPGNRANATIGRAVRLVAMNVIGARPSIQDEACMATPAKYTFCFAEAEPKLPWQPLRVQLGFDPSETTVTVVGTEGPRQVANFTNGDAEGLLRTFVSIMKAPASVIVGKGGQGIMVLGPEHEFVIRENGWTQAQVREFVVAETRVTPEEVAASGVPLEEPGNHHYLPPSPDGKYPTFTGVDDLLLITAGGHGAGWSAFIPSVVPSKHSRAVTRRVRTVGEALPDCGPDACEIDLSAILGSRFTAVS